ncbi:hypothetical protein MAP00_006227 [Monascus purpureus]|nr:hypothetical protein MAP00_006227 [Monascus purpureus]
MGSSHLSWEVLLIIWEVPTCSGKFSPEYRKFPPVLRSFPTLQQNPLRPKRSTISLAVFFRRKIFRQIQPMTHEKNRIRKKWRDAHRERQRVLPIPKRIQWGPYNLDFPTFDSAGILELRKFIQELDNEANWAKPREHIIADIMESLRMSKTKSPLEIIAMVPSILPTSDGDLFLLNDSQALYDRLEQKFEKPLLHRASLSGNSLCGRKLTLDAFWKHLREQPNKTIDVYDYAVVEPTSRTRRLTVQEVLLHWELPTQERHALNLLEIENRIGDFCPTEIVQHDLHSKLSLLPPDNVGKTDSNWKNSRKEFFLLSGANAISSIHVDNGGQLTWILILEGRKIWYFPRKPTSDALRLLATTGSQCPRGYEEGWARVELCAGDLLIMPPSCPHAVFTPDDCLAVGGHFYTAAHLGSTLRGLKLQEDYPAICNEDLLPDFYDVLRSVFQNAHSISSSLQQSEILSSSCLFLDVLDVASLAPLFKANRRNSNSRGTTNQHSKVLKQLESKLTSHGCLPTNRPLFLDALESFQRKILEDLEDES